MSEFFSEIYSNHFYALFLFIMSLITDDSKVLKNEGTETAAILSGTTKNFTRHNFFDKSEKE